MGGTHQTTDTSTVRTRLASIAMFMALRQSSLFLCRCRAGVAHYGHGGKGSRSSWRTSHHWSNADMGGSAGLWTHSVPDRTIEHARPEQLADLTSRLITKCHLHYCYPGRPLRGVRCTSWPSSDNHACLHCGSSCLARESTTLESG